MLEYMYKQADRYKHLDAKDQKILISKAQAGDQKAFDILVSTNMKLVISVAQKYQNTFRDVEDLIQAGAIGLMIAIKRFDYEKNVNLSTYAIIWIKQSISRYIMNNNSVIRIPIHVQNTIKAKSMNKKIIEECSDECIFDARRMYKIRSIESFFRAQKGSENENLDEYFGYYDHRIEENTNSMIVNNHLNRCFNKLSEREVFVLSERYGLKTGKPQTLDEIGKTLCVTRERIRQIQNKAFTKLRKDYRLMSMKEVNDGTT